MLSIYMSIFASAVYAHPAVDSPAKKAPESFNFTVELFSASGSSYIK